METLKTGRKVILAILFFLAGLTVAAGYRRTADRDYGRLFDRQLPVTQQPVVTRTIPVVTEAPAVAAPAVDPMLAAPVANANANANAEAPAPVAVNNDGASIVITRPNGERPRLLAGGIFKPQQ